MPSIKTIAVTAVIAIVAVAAAKHVPVIKNYI